jgi:acyl dehydratase
MSSFDTEMDLGRWIIGEEQVKQYLDAVGDTCPIYRESEVAPPIALAAYALGSLLRRLKLPPGAVHSIQEIEILSPVCFGEEISGIAHLERPRHRRGMGFITASFTLINDSGDNILTGKSTVLVVGDSA